MDKDPDFVIGMDVGGTRTKYGLVDLSTGLMVEKIILPTEKIETLFLQQIEDTYRKLLLNAGILHAKDVSRIGIGVPGFVDNYGVIDSTYGFLPFMEGYPLSKILYDHLNVTCYLDNDARTVALGESKYGLGRGYSRVLVMTLGTGLGIGFVVDGKFSDAQPFSHMGGHMKIRDNGEKCYCGKVGCLESLVSLAAIKSAVKKNNKGERPIDVDSKSIFLMAENKDPFATQIVDGIVDALRDGILNYVNLFAPEIIIIGGGMAKGLKPYSDALMNRDYLMPYRGYSVKLHISELQENSGILGAAELCNK